MRLLWVCNVGISVLPHTVLAVKLRVHYILNKFSIAVFW